MKKEKISVNIWLCAAAAAAVLAVLAVVLGMCGRSFVVLDQSVLEENLDAVFAAARTGDLAECGSRMDGAALGEAPAQNTPEGKLWYAYMGSISYTADSACRVEGNRLALDIQVTAMDMKQVLADINALLPELKNNRVQAGHNDELFDENNELKAPILEECLQEAVDTVLTKASSVTRDLTVYFVHRQNMWILQSTEAVIALLSATAE